MRQNCNRIQTWNTMMYSFGEKRQNSVVYALKEMDMQSVVIWICKYDKCKSFRHIPPGQSIVTTMSSYKNFHFNSSDH